MHLCGGVEGVKGSNSQVYGYCLQLGQKTYHDSESFSTTSFLANTREQSSHRFLSGSMVSLYRTSNVSRAFCLRWMYSSILASSRWTLSIQSSSIVSGRPPKMSYLSLIRRDNT